MPPYELIDVPDGDAPQEYTLSPNEQGRLSSVTFTCDGTAAAADFHPTVSFYAPSGELLARQFAELQTAGDVSEVTFAPFLKRPSEPAAPGGDELPSLCGGMGAGPIASETGPGTAALVLTLTRDVPCDCIVHIVPALLSLVAPFQETGDVVSVVDSLGNNWIAPGANTANIGARFVAQGGAPWDTLKLCTGWIRAYAANELSAGDTITVTFSLDTPPAATLAALAFAVTHTSVTASEQTFGGAGPLITHTNSDAFPTDGIDPRFLDWCADEAQCNPQNPRPVHFAAGLAAHLSWPDVSPFSPFFGAVIGELGGWGAGLAVTMDRCVVDDSTYDPGGGWAADADFLIGNYQFPRFVCPP